MHDPIRGRIRVTPKEVARAETAADGTLWTIVVRQQEDGSYLVMAVDVETGRVLSNGTAVEAAPRQVDIQPAVRMVNRWLGKGSGGFFGKMPGESRMRPTDSSIYNLKDIAKMPENLRSAASTLRDVIVGLPGTTEIDPVAKKKHQRVLDQGYELAAGVRGDDIDQGILADVDVRDHQAPIPDAAKQGQILKKKLLQAIAQSQGAYLALGLDMASLKRVKTEAARLPVLETVEDVFKYRGAAKAVAWVLYQGTTAFDRVQSRRASMDITARPTYQNYKSRFKAKPGGPQKPMSRDQWESKILGKPGKDKDEAPAKSYTKKYKPAVTSVMDAHSLTDDDADDVKAFKADKPSSGAKVSPSQLMQRFLSKAKPETKERMKGVSPADFMKMLGAIMDDEGTGKTASSLRAQIIRLAHAVPALRKHLVPILRKTV